MGGGAWSKAAYDDAAVTRSVTGTPVFKHTADISSGKVKVGAHADLDPKRLAGPKSPLAGKPIRESRDNDEHPESIPIAIIFDVTGSMNTIPGILQGKLPKLMDVIKDKAGIKHPHVLVGAVGDAYADTVPFQVGQFESDNRFDDQLQNIYLEGGGGGTGPAESYGLAYRWAADHTAHDAYERRGKKGFLFTMGDESPHMVITKKEVEAIFGIKAQADEPIESLIARASETWNIFHLRSLDGSYPDHHHEGAKINANWKRLLGERVIQVQDSSQVCEIIAGIVHMVESSLDAKTVVADIGLKGDAAKSVLNALAPIAKSLPSVLAEGSLPAKHSKAKGTVTRV